MGAVFLMKQTTFPTIIVSPTGCEPHSLVKVFGDLNIWLVSAAEIFKIRGFPRRLEGDENSSELDTMTGSGGSGKIGFKAS